MPILANVGIPMIVIHWPLMVCALVPVVILETALIRCWLSLSVRQALTAIVGGNVLSTLVGVPLAHFVMLMLHPVAYLFKSQLHSPVLEVLRFFFMAAWLPPIEWMPNGSIPAAVAVLLVPSFFVSLPLEYAVCRMAWRQHASKQVAYAVLWANLASYGLLFLLACGWIAFAMTI